MNKDTIYIEPEDDITDIIAKIENSKSKIVALVPPKKAGVLRSVVNMKLISKASKSAEKTVVLVTTDPSITKLAGASLLPVAKDLKSAPVVPVIENEDEKEETLNEAEETEVEEVEIEEAIEKAEEKTEAEEEENEEAKEEEDADDDGAEEDDITKKSKETKKRKSKKVKQSGNKFIDWVKSHKKLAALCGVLVLALIAFLIWALFVAPAVSLFVSIKTDTNNFSEVISFVKEQSQENIDEGKIYLEERKIETTQEVNFEATGQKNVGERARGTVTVSTYFKERGSVAINAGSIFTISGLSFASSENAVLSWDGDNISDCENGGQASLIYYGCLVYENIDVVATAAGSNYNVAASNSGWSTTANVSAVSSSKAMSGGTDNIITVVQQSDVEKAKNSLATANEEENKEKLYESIPEDSVILESTFSQTTSSATSTPAVDEEVGNGVTPTLKTTTTTSVYILDRTKLEELIRAKVDLPEDKKIFEIRDVYIDGFRELEGGYTGKLKAIYFTGPKITESEVVDKIKGRGLGDASREIRDIDGVSEVTVDPSYPWVFAVPTDSNRITVSFEIKDQNGQKIEEKTTDGNGSDDSETDDTEN